MLYMNWFTGFLDDSRLDSRNCSVIEMNASAMVVYILNTLARNTLTHDGRQ